MTSSRLYLPKLASPPSTILEYLVLKFPHVDEALWRDRMARGRVTSERGTLIDQETPYQYGTTIYYFKEAPAEPESPVSESVLFQDDHILVVDKPHGMRVTPSGNHVHRALLSRLQRSTDRTDIAPLHRLDQDTAGLILFSLQPESRARYHALFANRTVDRQYIAVSPAREIPVQKQWIVENRLEPGDPWYSQRIVPGLPNAATRIEWIRAHDGFGFFRLYPKTGRKHQLRVHMASIGFPIAGDRLYAQPLPSDPPLQLLAYELSFTDPITGRTRTFQTRQKLALFD